MPGLHAMSLPGTTRIAGWLFWLVFPVLSVVAIGYATNTLADHVGKPSESIRGTYTVASRDCDNHLCTVTGTFVSDDGFVAYARVPGDPRWQLDTSHRAYFTRAFYEADAEAQVWNPTTAVLALVGGVAYLAAVGWLAVASLRETAPRRRSLRRGSLQAEPNRTVKSG